jgi:hypothetical protein
VRSDIFALYAQDQIALTPQWKLLAGLRYDVFKVDFDDRRTTVPPTDLERTDREFSPRLGVIWTPDARSTYYASYSYAFLPSGEQLSLATGTVDLEPEKSTNYEIGARWDLLPGLTLSAALFRLDKDGVRSKDPAGSGLFIKTGLQRTQGVELGLAGEVTPRWQMYGGYAHLDAKVEKPLNTGSDPNAAAIPAGGASRWCRATCSRCGTASMPAPAGPSAGPGAPGRILRRDQQRGDAALVLARRRRRVLHLRGRTDARRAERGEPDGPQVLPDGGRGQQHLGRRAANRARHADVDVLISRARR